MRYTVTTAFTFRGISYPAGADIDMIDNELLAQLWREQRGNFVPTATVIDQHGSVRMQGSTTTWDDLRISGASTRVGVTAPTLTAFLAAGGLRVLVFGQAQHDEVHFEVQMPHDWKEGSAIYPHVHWCPITAEAGNVVWQLDYSWASHDGTFPAVATVTSDATAAGGTAWAHKMTALKDAAGNRYIDGTGHTISSMLVCRLHRDAGVGADTLTEGVAFLEFDIHYERDSFGSASELKKWW